MRVFRKNFLHKEKNIGIIPSGGYRFIENQSREGIQWLILKEREIGRHIIHEQEHRLMKGIFVNGYYEYKGEMQHHVLQFHGCFFHGCPTCYRDKPIGNSKETFDTRYKRTFATTRRLRQRGYIVTEKCFFDEEIHTNRDSQISRESPDDINSASRSS